MTTATPPSSPDIGTLSRQDRAHATPTRREMAFNIAVWILFTALWVAFFAALLLGQGMLDDTWHRVREFPLIVQGVIALLFLPLAARFWIWETAWPILVRLVLIAGLAWVNVSLFFPRRTER